MITKMIAEENYKNAETRLNELAGKLTGKDNLSREEHEELELILTYMDLFNNPQKK